MDNPLYKRRRRPFFLTDNGSDDGYIDILDKYIKNGTVSLNINPERHQQVKHLNFYINVINDLI